MTLKPGTRVVIRAAPPYREGPCEGLTGVLQRKPNVGAHAVLLDEPVSCPTCEGVGSVRKVVYVGERIVHPAQEVLL